LSGYLALAEKLYSEGQKYSGGWNFGPLDSDTKTVEQIVTQMCNIWGNGGNWTKNNSEHPHEANLLRLDCSKARMILGWHPVWNSETTLNKLTLWYKAYFSQNNMLELTRQQIDEYMKELVC
jgi:CDP-glucose 4,6-dehydratase